MVTLVFRVKVLEKVQCFIGVKNAHTVFLKLFYYFVIYFPRYVILLKYWNMQHLTFFLLCLRFTVVQILKNNNKKKDETPRSDKTSHSSEI